MLLDTDVFIDILRDDPDAMHWLTHQASIPLLSGVSALEAAFGAQSAQELRNVRRAFAEFEILWPDSRDVEFAANKLATIKLSHGLGAFDALTAAVAIRRKLKVVTLNVRHFRGVPGITLVQPYTR